MLEDGLIQTQISALASHERFCVGGFRPTSFQQCPVRTEYSPLFSPTNKPHRTRVPYSRTRPCKLNCCGLALHPFTQELQYLQMRVDNSTSNLIGRNDALLLCISYVVGRKKRDIGNNVFHDRVAVLLTVPWRCCSRSRDPAAHDRVIALRDEGSTNLASVVGQRSLLLPVQGYSQREKGLLGCRTHATGPDRSRVSDCQGYPILENLCRSESVQ